MNKQLTQETILAVNHLFDEPLIGINDDYQDDLDLIDIIDHMVFNGHCMQVTIYDNSRPNHGVVGLDMDKYQVIVNSHAPKEDQRLGLVYAFEAIVDARKTAFA